MTPERSEERLSIENLKRVKIYKIKNNVKKTILLESSENSRLTLSPSNISLEILRNPPPKSSFSQGRKTIGVLLEGKFESVYKNRILPKNQKVKFKQESEYNKMIIVLNCM